MNNPVTLSTFALLDAHHHHPSAEFSSSFTPEPLCPAPPQSLLPRLLAAPLHSVSDLTTPRASRKWGRTVVAFL